MTIFRYVPRLLLLLSTLAVLNACGDEDDDMTFAGEGGGSGEIVVDNNITRRMETPQVLTDGSTILRSYTSTEGGRETVTLSLEYSKSKLHSRWVAFRYDGITRAMNVSRTDDFKDDYELPEAYRIGSRGFGSGYDRGHLCASHDRLYSTRANTNTFYMTNMSPQLSSFNQDYWVVLENHVQKLGRNTSFSDTLYVVKGGTIRDDQIKDYVNREGGKRVAVPKYYYMALLKVKGGAFSSIAFLLEHKNYMYDKPDISEMKKHIVSVNSLEEFTDINFFPNLPDSKEELVEDQIIPANWGF